MNLTTGVVIPAFDAEAFVVDALESVASQARPPDRVAVVDDGSRDRTASVVEAWAADSGLPLTLHRQENQGVSAARNAGIERLTGADLIALLDADDVWKPWHLERCASALERHSDLVLCFGNRQAFDASGPMGASFFRDKEVPPVRQSASSTPGSKGTRTTEAEAVRDQAAALLYTASTRGMSVYLSSVARVIRSGIWKPTLRPRNVARALLCTLPFYRSRRQETSRR